MYAYVVGRRREAFVSTHDPKRRRCSTASFHYLRLKPWGDSLGRLGRARSAGPRAHAWPGPLRLAARRRGCLPGALGAQTQDQEQQGHGQSQAREAEELRQPRLQPEAAHARGHVFCRPVRAPPRWVAPGLSLGGFSRLRSPGPGRVADCGWRWRECHRGPWGWDSKFLDSPPPAHPRAPPRSATASGPGASGKRRPGSSGQEEGPKKGEGSFPESEPPKACRRGFLFWVGRESPNRGPSGGGTLAAPEQGRDVPAAPCSGGTRRAGRAAGTCGVRCAAVFALHSQFAHTLLLKAYCMQSLVPEARNTEPGVVTLQKPWWDTQSRKKADRWNKVLQNNAKGRRSGTSPTGCP